MFFFKKLFDAVKKLCKEENINEKRMRELVIECLEQSYIKSILKNNSDSIERPRIKISFNKSGSEIYFFIIKKIKKEVVDDMLEIEMDDAKALTKKNNLKYGDDVEILDDFLDNKNKLEVFINCFKRIFQRKIDDEKKTVLYSAYKDHINENVMAIVEKIDNRGATVKIGEVSILLPQKEMIGDEFFVLEQQIKVFLQDTSTDKKKSISITRANDGFLKRILEEEIYEIYDGTIVVKDIVRVAGKRSKVAVYSTIDEVNATGSCIGKNGVRLAKIVDQLGGNGFDKERVDIILYSDNPLFYIINAIRPAEAVGAVITDEENKKAICIVKDNQYLKAVGLKGINVKLASKLTGYELDIIEEKDAEGIDYISKTVFEKDEITKKAEKNKKKFLESVIAHNKKKSESSIEEISEKKDENDNFEELLENNDNNSDIDDYKNKFSNIETTSLSEMEKKIEKNVSHNNEMNNKRKTQKSNSDNIVKKNKLEEIKDFVKKKEKKMYSDEEIKDLEQENDYSSDLKNDENFDEYDNYYNNDDKDR
ncbi:MAG: hypothetical protein J6Y70_00165 [Bacilli bacterium]|nr:hypothetical protein [Bacilli bacterium]